jgi:hypothetical protein
MKIFIEEVDMERIHDKAMSSRRTFDGNKCEWHMWNRSNCRPTALAGHLVGVSPQNISITVRSQTAVVLVEKQEMIGDPSGKIKMNGRNH